MATSEPRRYVLVPRAEPEPVRVPGAARIRRFSLARLAISPRSELGFDRHERMERAARDGRGHTAR